MYLDFGNALIFLKGVLLMKRKLFIFALVVFIALQICAPLSASASAPAGYVIDDARDGYIVYTAKGLFEVAKLINNGRNANIFLGADIDIAGRKWVPIGISPEQCYTGTIDGRGHSLRGLTVEQEAYAALVGYADGVCIKDLTLENVYIKAKNNSACVVARAEGDVTVTGCAVSGYVSIEGDNAAGLVGSSVAENILVEDCVLDVDIIGKSRLSEVLGSEARGNSKSMPKYTFRNVIALGSCTDPDIKNENYIGSLIGYFNDLELKIENCIALTKIESAEGAGGIIGTARCGSVSINDTITSDSLVGTLYPDARATDHSYKNCYLVADGAENAAAIEKIDLGKNTVNVEVNGTRVQPAEANVPCMDTNDAIDKAKTFFASNETLASFAKTHLDTISDHEHEFSCEAASPRYIKAEAQCPTHNTYFKSCICGEKGEDTFVAGNKAMHLTGSTLFGNADGHWYACEVCGDDGANISTHVFTQWSTDGKNTVRTCRVCNFVEKQDNAEGGCGAYVGMSGLTLVAVSTACAFILKKKK